MKIHDMNDKQVIKLSESGLRRLIKESINEALDETGKTNKGINVDEVVRLILDNEELSEKALTCLSPRFMIFPSGTKSQQDKWRTEEFINQTPEIFKPIMSLRKRREIADRVYIVLRQRYPRYF